MSKVEREGWGHPMLSWYFNFPGQPIFCIDCTNVDWTKIRDIYSFG